MKQFIYLDSDIVTSIIAQSEKGLVTQQTDEIFSGKQDENKNQKSINGNVEGKFSLIKLLKINANAGLEDSKTISATNQESTRKVVEKIFHDAAFDVAHRYINPVVVDNDNKKTFIEGQYIFVKRRFDVMDFEYLEHIFSEGGYAEYLKKSRSEEINNSAKNITDSLNREQQRNSKIGKELSSKIKQQIEESNQEIDNIRDIVKAYRSIVPYSRMIVSSDGFIIPLEDRYFRIDPASLGFKYGGELTCVGMVTNIIPNELQNQENASAFTTLQQIINDSLRTVLSIPEDLYIIHPIAVYYGD